MLIIVLCFWRPMVQDCTWTRVEGWLLGTRYQDVNLVVEISVRNQCF